MAIINEPTRLGDIIRRESDPGFSREEVVVKQGQNLPLGTVLGRRTISCPETGTAKAGNIGNGAMELVTPGLSVQLGAYRIICAEAAENGGAFIVLDPNGNRMADASVGSAYDEPQLSFVISDGGADFAVGDEFTIAVTEGDGQVVALDPGALDGAQIACGILAVPCDATNAASRAVAITSGALVLAEKLGWPDNITAPEKALALKQLAARGILDRKGV
jgi:hypothetical protein